MSAPSSAQRASFSVLPAVTATVAPTALASWIAIVPMPLEPPCTSSVSPGRRWAIMKTFDQTVQVTSGSAAAVTRSTPSGTGSSWPAGTATFSAYPPPASSAHTSSPTDQPDTPAPSAAIRPEHSRPGYGGRAGRRIVEPLALEQIGAVDGARRHLDQHLALAGHRIGDLGPDERLGATGFRNRDRMHAGEATPGVRSCRQSCP